MIVVDTSAWLWWLHDPALLGAQARERLEKEAAEGELLVSAISVWEVALKVSLGKLFLPMDVDSWFEAARSYPRTRLVDVTPTDLTESTRLPMPFHRDPADRIIVALARRSGVPLVTSDGLIREYPHVQTIW